MEILGLSSSLPKLFSRKEELRWDQPEEYAGRWSAFIKGLPPISEIMIPRWVRNGASPVVGGQMHVFGDASRTEYAAVVYLRFLRRDESHSSHFITSKNRAAPFKKTSITRLELLAALLTARLSEYVRRTLAYENWPLFC